MKNEKVRTAKELAQAVRKRIERAKAEIDAAEAEADHAADPEQPPEADADGGEPNFMAAGVADLQDEPPEELPPDAIASHVGSSYVGLLYDIRGTINHLEGFNEPNPLPGTSVLLQGALEDDIAIGGIRTKILLAGDNGTGKSFIANLWLMQTIQDSCSYARAHADKDMHEVLVDLEAFKCLQLKQAHCHGLLPDSMPQVDIRYNQAANEPWSCETAFELPEGEANVEQRQVVLTVRPEEFVVDAEEEYGKTWQPIEDYFLDGRAGMGNHGCGFLLPSMERGRSTTAYRTVICYGCTIHMLVEYLSEAAALAKAQDYINSYSNYLRTKKLELARLLAKLNSPPPAHNSELKFEYETFKQLCHMFDKIPSLDYEVTLEDIRPEIREVLRKSHVKTGRGDDLNADRIFIRACIQRLHEKSENFHAAITGVTIYAPAGVVADGREIIDPPGSNDTNAFHETELQEGIREAHMIVAIGRRNLESEANLMSSLASAGFWEKLANNPDTYRLVYFPYMETEQVVLDGTHMWLNLRNVCSHKSQWQDLFEDVKNRSTSTLEECLQVR